jgi:hypothetical protein
MATAKLSIGQILRYPRAFEPQTQTVDGYSNFWHITYADGLARPQLEKGINPIASVRTASGVRRPAILISSSPHRVGSVQTPWHDIFDSDNGHIRYFGDAKTPGQDPARTPGNKALLEAHRVHSAIDPAERSTATPILFFRRTSVDGVQKGYLTFQGYGVVERAERITQFDSHQNASFTNYVYDFAVLAMTEENETFDWEWVNARRNPSLSDPQCYERAPRAWKRWLVKGGRILGQWGGVKTGH